FYKSPDVPNNNHFKCQQKCYGMKLGILSSTGDINVQRWADLFDYLVVALAQKCVQMVEQDLCEKSYLLTLSDIRNSWKGPVEPFITECLSETHANPQLVEDFFKNGVLSDDPCFKCALKCVEMKLNVMSPTGEVDAQQAVRIYPHISLQLVQRCADENAQESDLCHKMYLIEKCVYDGVANSTA
ncbi:hypothetical protein ILUMI_17435, partial [Ignelater luminosus]